MGSKKSGGKLRLTRETHELIVSYLEAGAFQSVAAQAAGIDRDTLADWLRRGKAGEKAYAKFAADVLRVQGEDCVRLARVVTAAAVKRIDGDWKAAAWALERKYPKLYGRQAAPALGMTVNTQQGDDDDIGGSNVTRTRFEFYLPDNGRRPQDLTGDDEDGEEEET
jgi:hypothetical protein